MVRAPTFSSPLFLSVSARSDSSKRSELTLHLFETGKRLVLDYRLCEPECGVTCPCGLKGGDVLTLDSWMIRHTNSSGESRNAVCLERVRNVSQLESQ